MARDDKDVKHVIILDENRPKEEEPEVDETEELLKELRELAGEDDEEDPDETVKPVKKPRPARKRHISDRLKKLITVLLISLVILVLVILFAAGSLDKGYREPVKIYEECLNTPECDGEELSFAYGNGLARRSFEELRDIQRRFEDYNRALDGSREAYRAWYDKTCADYGDDRKYSVTIDEAVPLSEGEILALTGDFEGMISDLSVSSYARAADPELVSALKELTDKMKDARISAGYKLYCTQNIQGGLGDGPVSVMEKCEFTVVKLDGHWVMWDKIYDIFRMTY